jgi:hypothetical protein
MKPLKNLLMLALTMSLLLPNIAMGAEQVGPPAPVANCKEVVQAADRALKAQDVVLDLRLKEISAHNDLEAVQDTHIQQLEKDKNSIFSSPWLYFGLGVVAGVFVVRRNN